MKWRGMITDAFYDVEASTEDEARRKVLEIVKREIERGEITLIVWEESDAADRSDK